VAEVAHAGEDHGEAALVRRCDHFPIAHRAAGLDEGRTLVKQLRGRVSGLCQPTYVLDIPGGHGKAPVGPDHLSGDAATGYVVEDYRGGRHAYPPRGL
jgi:lysine 2,3-aminomutase